MNDWGGSRPLNYSHKSFLRPETFEKKFCESLRPQTLCVRDAFCAQSAAANNLDLLRCEFHLSFDLRPLQNTCCQNPCAARTVL